MGRSRVMLTDNMYFFDVDWGKKDQGASLERKWQLLILHCSQSIATKLRVAGQNIRLRKYIRSGLHVLCSNIFQTCIFLESDEMCDK